MSRKKSITDKIGCVSKGEVESKLVSTMFDSKHKRVSLSIYDKVLYHSRYKIEKENLDLISKLIVWDVMDKSRSVCKDFKSRVKNLGRYLSKTELDYNGEITMNKDIYGCQVSVIKDGDGNHLTGVVDFCKTLNEDSMCGIDNDLFFLKDHFCRKSQKFDSYLLTNWRWRSFQFEIKFVFFEQPDHINYEISRLSLVNLDDIDSLRVQQIVIADMITSRRATEYQGALLRLFSCNETNEFNKILTSVKDESNFLSQKLIKIHKQKYREDLAKKSHNLMK